MLKKKDSPININIQSPTVSFSSYVFIISNMRKIIVTIIQTIVPIETIELELPRISFCLTGLILRV